VKRERRARCRRRRTPAGTTRPPSPLSRGRSAAHRRDASISRLRRDLRAAERETEQRPVRREGAARDEGIEELAMIQRSRRLRVDPIQTDRTAQRRVIQHRVGARTRRNPKPAVEQPVPDRLGRKRIDVEAHRFVVVDLAERRVDGDLVGEGFLTKESVRDHVFENCFVSLDEYWQYHLVEGFSRRMGEKGVEPYASWLTQPGDTMISRYRSPDEISILVVGGRTNDFWQAGDWHLIGSFSIDEWR